VLPAASLWLLAFTLPGAPVKAPFHVHLCLSRPLPCAPVPVKAPPMCTSACQGPSHVHLCLCVGISCRHLRYPPQTPGQKPGDWWEAHSWEPCANINTARYYPRCWGGGEFQSPLTFRGQQGHTLDVSRSGAVTPWEGKGPGRRDLAALAGAWGGASGHQHNSVVYSTV